MFTLKNLHKLQNMWLYFSSYKHVIFFTGIDLWQNSYLGGIQPSSSQTFSKTLFMLSVYV